ncbi:MAG: hypothetical protein M0Z51_16450 [Propionibacterium sp.]|nr:hypothetical protein [Propionibacterium sp.]
MLLGKQSTTVWKDPRKLGDQVAKMIDQMLGGSTVDVNDTKTYNYRARSSRPTCCRPRSSPRTPSSRCSSDQASTPPRSSVCDDVMRQGRRLVAGAPGCIPSA